MFPDNEKASSELAPVRSGLIPGDVEDVQDAVFGEITKDGPNYRNVRAYL
jgi:hypothetical protein